MEYFNKKFNSPLTVPGQIRDKRPLYAHDLESGKVTPYQDANTCAIALGITSGLVRQLCRTKAVYNGIVLSREDYLNTIDTSIA